MGSHTNGGGTKRHKDPRLYLGDAQEKKNRHKQNQQIQSNIKCSRRGAGIWHKLLGDICSSSAKDHNTTHHYTDHDPRMARMPTGLRSSIPTKPEVEGKKQ